MNNFSINLAVNCIKTLVDECRCVNCDELNETRLRYVCGHSLCEKCVVINAACVLCSPTSNDTPILDKPQSKRTRHASELLNAFQDLFDVNVYRQHRISEQLKVEKEIFPECIQAPMKYFNKRKSSVLTDKENIRPSLLPGESISISEKAKMEKSINYVQQWLNQNEKSNKSKKSRKPFADISVNSQNNMNVTKNKRSILNKTYADDFENRPKRSRKDYSTDTTEAIKKVCENYESGIGLDADDSSIIDDSQSDIVDKDKLALMAVVQADQNENSFIEADIDLNKVANKDLPKCCLQSTSVYKVPFYKKSLLTENCSLCIKDLEIKDDNKKPNSTKNVIVTIDNKSFTTVIKVSEIKPSVNKNAEKKSIAIQTGHIESTFEMKDESIVIKDLPCEAINNIVSEDIFKNDIDIQAELSGNANKSKCLIIEDSDSDSSAADDGQNEVEVEAQIHRSSDILDYVLAPIKYEDYRNRARPVVRGNTPASSDSSDKENFDPNKKKRARTNTKYLKNKKMKKK